MYQEVSLHVLGSPPTFPIVHHLKQVCLYIVFCIQHSLAEAQTKKRLLKDVVDLCGLPLQKTNLMRHLTTAVYINGKVMKCPIWQKLFHFNKI